VQSFVELAGSERWRFTSIVCADAWSGWRELADALDLPLEDELPSASDGRLLLVARRPHPGRGTWDRGIAQIDALERGLSFVLCQPSELPAADIAGTLDRPHGARPDLLMAIETVRHPESRLARRMLREGGKEGMREGGNEGMGE
jgi:hypothetical protein